MYKVNKTRERCKFPLINYWPNMTLVCLGRVNTQPRDPLLINIRLPRDKQVASSATSTALALHVDI